MYAHLEVFRVDWSSVNARYQKGTSNARALQQRERVVQGSLPRMRRPASSSHERRQRCLTLLRGAPRRHGKHQRGMWQAEHVTAPHQGLTHVPVSV